MSLRCGRVKASGALGERMAGGMDSRVRWNDRGENGEARALTHVKSFTFNDIPGYYV
jgi:hypothetical protein